MKIECSRHFYVFDIMGLEIDTRHMVVQVGRRDLLIDGVVLTRGVKHIHLRELDVEFEFFADRGHGRSMFGHLNRTNDQMHDYLKACWKKEHDYDDND